MIGLFNWMPKEKKIFYDIKLVVPLWKHKIVKFNYPENKSVDIPDMVSFYWLGLPSAYLRSRNINPGIVSTRLAWGVSA